MKQEDPDDGRQHGLGHQQGCPLRRPDITKTVIHGHLADQPEKRGDEEKHPVQRRRDAEASGDPGDTEARSYDTVGGIDDLSADPGP